MTPPSAALRAAAAVAFITLALAAPALQAAAEDVLGPAALADLAEADAPLKAARADLPDCEPGCMTPGEATALALALGEDEARAGRFLLDVRGGGQSLEGQLGTMLFVNSRRDYATLGTLTIAFEPEALGALLRRARGCGAADVVDGQITVKACYGEGVPDLNMFTMMQRLGGRRLIVEGKVRRNWIDSPLGSLRPVANFHGKHEVGYYQVWVHVTEAAQVTFADEG